MELWFWYRARPRSVNRGSVQAGSVEWTMHEGFISSGGDLWVEELTVDEAKRMALTLDGCQGFCFRGPMTDEEVEIRFKAHWDNKVGKNPWTSFKMEASSDV